MKAFVRLATSLVLGMGLVSGVSLAKSHGSMGTCKKAGKMMKVKGKTSEEMKMSCEHSGGQWTEAHTASKGHAPAKAAAAKKAAPAAKPAAAPAEEGDAGMGGEGLE